MANFKTHLLTAASLSGVAAIACMKADVTTAMETPVLFGLGTLGGLLPDIDSDNSVPIRISFNLLAFFLAFVTMFVFIGRYTVLELAAIWLGIFVGVRYLVLEFFIAFTTHRGAIHSLLAAVFFGLGTVSLAYHTFDKPYQAAWLYGFFVAFGFVVHLALDELFSVDLLGRRLKRSFGTALKPISLKYWRATALLALAVAMVYQTVPSPAGFPATVWRRLEAHYTGSKPWLMPPEGNWFNHMGDIFMGAFCAADMRGGSPAKKSATPK
ncbi:metal-dependent hydrolase [Methylomagnum sp.]